MTIMVNFPDKNVLLIDGSYGEGGGQILRTSLALSCVLGRQVEIINIRKARKKPGLQPQHLTAVKAAAAVSHARVEGAELSSTELRFFPSPVIGGDYYFDVSETRGSAGSALLVLQTVLLPLCFAKHSSTITVVGGTHVPWSPTFHYFRHVFITMLSRMGVSVDASLETWGWYPTGGGKVRVHISPPAELLPIVLTERGKLVRLNGISAASNLPRDIAVRQMNQAVTALSRQGMDGEVEIVSAPSPGKGTLVFLLAEFDRVTTGFDALGAIGKRAEEVADEAALSLFEYLQADAALDPHLADQIIPYLALSQGTSEFTASRISRHLLTNIGVVKQFMDIDIRVEGVEGEAGKVTVHPAKYDRIESG
jgi:RNA 3'-terminal phosphate cyclase (ATP)